MTNPDDTSSPEDRRTNQQGSVRLDVPAVLRYLNLPAAVLYAVAERMPGGPPSDTVAELELALQEACVNSVRHALAARTDARLRLEFTFEPGQISVALEDSGSPFVAEGVEAPDLDQPQEGGYGLFLIEQLVDSVSYERVDETNRWRMIKQWKGKTTDGD